MLSAGREAHRCPALKRPIPDQPPSARVCEREEGTCANHYRSKTQRKVPGCCIWQQTASTLPAAVRQPRRGVPRTPIAVGSGLWLFLHSGSSGGLPGVSDSCHHHGSIRKSWKSLWGTCTPVAGPAPPGDAGVTLPAASPGGRCHDSTHASFGAMGRYP